MSAPRVVEPRGWRDELTPLSRASRRRWAVACGGALLLCGAVALAGTETPNSALVLPLVLLVVTFGMLRRGTRRLTARDHPELDERDSAAVDGAVRSAFPLLVAVVVVTLLTVGAVEPQRIIDGSPYDRLEPLSVADLALPLAIWTAVCAVVLPTITLAWAEPDTVVPEEASAPLGGEHRRDLLLAVAFGASFLADHWLNGFVATTPLLAYLCWLAVVASRGGRAGWPHAVARAAPFAVLLAFVVALVIAAIDDPGGLHVTDAAEARSANLVRQIPYRDHDGRRRLCMLATDRFGRPLPRADAAATWRAWSTPNERQSRDTRLCPPRVASTARIAGGGR